MSSSSPQQHSSSSHSSSRNPSQASYFVTPNPNSPTTPTATGHWMVATVIDDNDLMFGGKSLSAWYEEDRCRQQSSGSKVEQQPERRGRSRERHGHRHRGSHGGGGKP